MFKLADFTEIYYGPNYLAKQMRLAIKAAEDGQPWPYTKYLSLLIYHTLYTTDPVQLCDITLCKHGAADETTAQNILERNLDVYQRVFEVSRDEAAKLLLRDLRTFCPEVLASVKIAQNDPSQTAGQSVQDQPSQQTDQEAPAQPVTPDAQQPQYNINLLDAAMFLLSSPNVNPTAKYGFMLGIPLLLLGLYGTFTNRLGNIGPLLLLIGLGATLIPPLYYMKYYPETIQSFKDMRQALSEQKNVSQTTDNVPQAAPAPPVEPPPSQQKSIRGIRERIPATDIYAGIPTPAQSPAVPESSVAELTPPVFSTTPSETGSKSKQEQLPA